MVVTKPEGQEESQVAEKPVEDGGCENESQPPWRQSFNPVFSQFPTKMLTLPLRLSGSPGDASHFIDVETEAGSPNTSSPQVHCTRVVLGLESKVTYNNCRLIKTSPTMCLCLCLSLLFYPEDRHMTIAAGKGLILLKAGLGDSWLEQGLGHQSHKVASQGLSSSAVLPGGGVVCPSTQHFVTCSFRYWLSWALGAQFPSG